MLRFIIVCSLEQIWRTYCQTGWLADAAFPGVCALQLHGDSVAGMMETCAQIDSISERQLPWVNGELSY